MGESITDRSQRFKHVQFTLVVLFGTFLWSPAFAQEQVNRGSFTLSYQHVREGDISLTIGDVDIGSLYTHSLLMEVEYSLNDKLNIYGSLPFIMKKYDGTKPHHPASFVETDVHESFIDDGDYHSNLQDLSLGIRYLVTNSRLQVTPFMSYGVPTSNYPIFAHAAVGNRLEKLQIGAEISYMPIFSDFYYNASLSRVFTEKTHVNVDYWRLDGEIGYFLKPNLAINAFFLSRQGNGLKFPDDFPPPRDNIEFYEHERLLKVEYIFLGMGLDWAFDPRYQLSIAVMTTAHWDMIHKVDYAFSIGITRAF